MKLIFLITLTLISTTLNAQEVIISGKIIDKETNEPIPGANVYLSNTVSGASTGTDGEYTFSTELEGNFVLVATFIGYKTQSKPIILKAGNNQIANFQLNEDVTQLGEIVVRSSNKEWQKQLSQFKDFFLGTDNFASQTNILNPEMINFELESGKIRVTNLQPIKINNNALGYNITVEFEDVVFDPFRNTGVYIIYPKFDEMKARNRNQERRWKKNREKSYIGSSRHFFRSLFEDNVRSNRFKIYPNSNVIKKSEDPRMLQSLFGSNWKYIYENYSSFIVRNKALEIGHDLTLDYTGKPKNTNELSSFNINGYYNLLIINKVGLIYNPASVVLVGKWGYDRFSKYLPIDYKL